MMLLILGVVLVLIVKVLLLDRIDMCEPPSSDGDADLDDAHPSISEAAEHRRTSNVQRRFVAAAKRVPVGEMHTYDLGMHTYDLKYRITDEVKALHTAFIQLKKDNIHWLEMKVMTRFEDHKIATWIAFTRLR